MLRFTEAAPLKEALTVIWEKARAKQVQRLRVLWLRVFDRADAFKLLSAVRQVPKAERDVTLSGGYETKRSSSLQFEFKGPIEDAEPLKEFLEAQFRGAADTDLNTQFELRFEGGLDLGTDAPEDLERAPPINHQEDRAGKGHHREARGAARGVAGSGHGDAREAPTAGAWRRSGACLSICGILDKACGAKISLRIVQEPKTPCKPLISRQIAQAD